MFLRTVCPQRSCPFRLMCRACGVLTAKIFLVSGFSLPRLTAGQVFPLGVSTEMRVRQCRQEATRAILKWSIADLLMMMFSVLHEGHKYRITYPARVPRTSG